MVAWPHGLRAQPVLSTVPAGSAAAEADALVARGDTAGAVALLETRVRRSMRDGVSWHRLGHLYWEQARSNRRGGYISDPRTIRLLQAADSALRLATQFAPDSARYWLNLGRFNLESGVSTMRFSGTQQADKALSVAKRHGDALLTAEAEDQVGQAAWRRFEATSNRALIDPLNRIQLGANGAPTASDPTALLNPDNGLNAGAFNRNLGRDYVMSVVKHLIKPPTGAADLETAHAHFQRAVQQNPSSQRYARHLAMTMATRKQWEELRQLASERAKAFPFDAESRLMLGLALWRSNQVSASRAAFDSALVLLDEREQARLTSITRVLRPGSPIAKARAGTGMDSLTYSKLPVGQQQAVTRAFWESNDPLASTTENEMQLELLARVVYADLRWTDDMLGYRGADTDRGRILVRYGPPDLEITMGSALTASRSGGEAGVTLVWSYDFGITFFFDLRPGFASADIAMYDQPFVEGVFEQRPLSMHNLAVARDVDSLPLRPVQFRATGDSTDVVLVGAFTPRQLLGDLELESVTIASLVKATDFLAPNPSAQRGEFRVASAALDTPTSRHWTQRVGRNVTMLRVELTQDDSRRALRNTQLLQADSGRGFGMSDVLITRPLPPERAPSATSTQRWSALGLTPVGDVADSGSTIGLVWEVYDLAPGEAVTARNGQYRVSVQLQSERGALATATLRLRDGLGRLIGRPGSNDPFSIAFDRTAVVQTLSLDYVSLDLGTLPRGRYRLRVDILDLNSQRKTFRDTALEVR